MFRTIPSPAILITDDDRAFRETLESLFVPIGFRTFLAADGEQAVAVIGAEDIHVALLDIQMPRMNGLEAMQRIHQRVASLPCILISGAIDREHPPVCDAFGVLCKPISQKQVTDIVFTALGCTYAWGPEWTSAARGN